MADNKPQFAYIHGISPKEQARLIEQARFGEYSIYQHIDFSECSTLLEVGCGVGAQTEILLRRFPKLHVTGIDFQEEQLNKAKEHLANQHIDPKRYRYLQMNAEELDFEAHEFDAAFFCWSLEHMANPLKVLSEVRRVLTPGGKIYLTEVMNSSLFLEPYSPHVWNYWMKYNDYQYDRAGDPFIGAKLGNLLNAVGFRDVKTRVIAWHFDNRTPENQYL